MYHLDEYKKLYALKMNSSLFRLLNLRLEKLEHYSLNDFPTNFTVDLLVDC